MEDQTSIQKIAIIGGGPAGLTAAKTLKQHGYKHVTIFERNDHVGGKCHSVSIDGKLYELGAGIITENATTVLELVKQFNIPIERVQYGRSVVVDTQTGKPLPKKSFRQHLRLLYEALFVYRKLCKRYADITKPGFAQLEKELSLPFSEFVEQYGLHQIAKEFALFFSGFGYDYIERISTFYVLKYYPWLTLMAFAKRKVYFFPEGIQHLWTAIAKEHDVRLNTTITTIKRADQVEITTTSGTESFDTLIIASPLDEALTFLDASKEEQSLFSKIQTVDYRTVACSVEGIEQKAGYLPGNFSSSKVGEPVYWHYRHEEASVYTFYLMAELAMTDEEITKRLKAFIEKMKGRIKEVHSINHWNYFPHVSPEVAKDGYYQKLDQLQGKQKTYYIGELFNFSTVRLTTQYAQALIKKHF